MMLDQLRDCALSLYDGGWRSSDKEALMYEYGLTAEYAEEICEKLEEIESTLEGLQ